MKNRKRSAIVALAATVAALGLATAVGGSAGAANECSAWARNSFVADYMETQDPSGSCSYLKVQFQYQPAAPGTYYRTGLTTTVVAGVIYETDTAAELVKGRACSDTSTDSCTYGSWFTNTDWYTYP